LVETLDLLVDLRELVGATTCGHALAMRLELFEPSKRILDPRLVGRAHRASLFGGRVPRRAPRSFATVDYTRRFAARKGSESGSNASAAPSRTIVAGPVRAGG